jgi:hypothetical protein
MMQMYLASAAGTRRINGKTLFKYAVHLIPTDGGEIAAEARVRGLFSVEYPDYEIGIISVLEVTKTVRDFVDDNPRVH